MIRILTASALILGSAGMSFGNGAVSSEYLAIEWKLIAIDDQPFAARATVDLSEPGRVTGSAPCNRFLGSYEGSLPEFRPGEVMSTRRACPDLEAELQFFDALSSMTRAKVSGPNELTMTGEDGRSMTYLRPVN